MAERQPLLQVEEFSGGYVDGIDIIHEIALDLFQDEILTIIGPNGAGKSTLLKAIVGALPFERGRRLFQGEDVSGWSTPRMIASGVGYVPQVDNVFTSMSIRENLEMGGYMRRTGLQERIAEVLAMFPDLESRPRERASRLSGGQRQMLAMARALMLDPVMLCLDEPTAALAPAARGELLARIYKIHLSGVGILMVEQNATEALVWSDRAVVMVDGAKALEGSGTEMLTSADVGRAFLGQDEGEGFALDEGGSAIEIAQLVTVGIIVGSIIALGAMGLTLVFGVLGIGDFAHGDKMGWGMFLAFFVVSAEGANLGFAGGRFGSLSFGWGLVVGLLVAMIGVAVISVVLERLVFRRLRASGGGFFVFAIASLGISIMLRAAIQLIWGPSNFRYTPGIHPAIEILGGIKVKPDQFFIVGITILAAVLLYWLLYRTRFGKAMRATADNPGLAEASGIETDRIRVGTWIIAGILGALAGVMLGLQAEVRFDAGFRLLLPLFAAVILGGIGNPWGALIGGLTVGIAQEVSTQWINTGLKPGVPFVIVIVVLLLRPRGLFGQVR